MKSTFGQVRGEVAFLLLILSVSVLSAAEGELLPPAGLKKSQWTSNDGTAAEIWLVKRADGSVELIGRDLASSFSGLLLKGDQPDAYSCHGTGFRFDGGFPFAYRSTFSLKEKDGAKMLVEKWQAIFASGEMIEGETAFQLVVEE